MIVIDTNVLSETIRLQPNQSVVRWLKARPVESLFTTAVTQAELLYGLALMPDGKRKSALATAVERMFATTLAERVLPFDSDAAHAFALIVATRRRAGRPIAHIDAQIAAIARSRDAAIATRDVGDFEGCGVDLINPWDA